MQPMLAILEYLDEASETKISEELFNLFIKCDISSFF